MALTGRFIEKPEVHETHTHTHTHTHTVKGNATMEGSREYPVTFCKFDFFCFIDIFFCAWRKLGVALLCVCLWGGGGGGGGVVIQCCPTLSQSQGSGMFLGRGGRGHDLFTKLPFTFPLLLDCRHIRRASRNQEFMGIGASSPFATDAEKG